MTGQETRLIARSMSPHLYEKKDGVLELSRTFILASCPTDTDDGARCHNYNKGVVVTVFLRVIPKEGGMCAIIP